MAARRLLSSAGPRIDRAFPSRAACPRRGLEEVGMIASALGSYPRIGEGAEAQKLRRSIQKFQAGGMTREALRQVEDEVTVEALGAQAGAGLDWVTDGLIRWE